MGWGTEKGGLEKAHPCLILSESPGPSLEGGHGKFNILYFHKLDLCYSLEKGRSGGFTLNRF